jgi:hypothetical protein
MGELNLPTIASGQLQPYQTSNNADAALESAVADSLELDLASGDHALTGAEFTRAVYFRTVHNSIARVLTVPDSAHLFVVENAGSADLTVESGTIDITVGAGQAVVFYTDGTSGGITAIAGSTAGGAAGGDLTGTYPNPTIKNDVALGGNPTAATQAPGNNTTRLATTAFVTAAIAAIVGGMVYKGTWNATTNSPAITSGVGTLGWFYKVSVAGTTTIDGNSQWNVGDLLLFDGSAWDRIEGDSTEVISVAGRTGVVVLAAGDVSGLAASATTDATNASNISSGTLAAARVGAIRFHLKTFLAGIQTSANQLLLRDHAAIAATLPTSGSKASAGTAATADTTFTIKKNGSSVGTILFSAAGTTGAFTIASPVSIAIDDIITIVGPASADATLADISITLATTAAGA